jgi:hypothetical protein
VGDVEAGLVYGMWGLAITLWGVATAWINDNLGILQHYVVNGILQLEMFRLDFFMS